MVCVCMVCVSVCVCVMCICVCVSVHACVSVCARVLHVCVCMCVCLCECACMCVCARVCDSVLKLGLQRLEHLWLGSGSVTRPSTSRQVLPFEVQSALCTRCSPRSLVHFSILSAGLRTLALTVLLPWNAIPTSHLILSPTQEPAHCDSKTPRPSPFSFFIACIST